MYSTSLIDGRQTYCREWGTASVFIDNDVNVGVVITVVVVAAVVLVEVFVTGRVGLVTAWTALSFCIVIFTLRKS